MAVRSSLGRTQANKYCTVQARREQEPETIANRAFLDGAINTTEGKSRIRAPTSRPIAICASARAHASLCMCGSKRDGREGKGRVCTRQAVMFAVMFACGCMCKQSDTQCPMYIFALSAGSCSTADAHRAAHRVVHAAAAIRAAQGGHACTCMHHTPAIDQIITG